MVVCACHHILKMHCSLLRVVVALALGQVACPLARAKDDDDIYKLPDGFLLGMATSNYQMEGAWNISGKGESMLDYGYHKLGSLNADITCDGYHHIKEDIKLLKSLKVNAYRFSLSWSRLLPNGSTDSPNPDGIRFYDEILEELKAANIEPIVSLSHFEYPLALDKNHIGWLDEVLIDKFVEFADFAFKQFGSKVRYWITMNEPNMYCKSVYDSKLIPPGGLLSSTPADAIFRCAHYQLIAHAKTFRQYKQHYYNSTQDGKIGIAINTCPSRPYDNTSSSDIAASMRYNTLMIDWNAHPVTAGDYPELLKTTLAEYSYIRNLNGSVLPEFNETEKKILKDSVDFLGLNLYYGTEVIKANSTVPHGLNEIDDGFTNYVDSVIVSSAKNTTVFLNNILMTCTPWVMRYALLHIRDNYNNTPVFITESGYQECNEGLNDTRRAAYYSEYMREMTRAANVDNVSVIGMTAWTFMDDFEWHTYKVRMGIARVNFSTPNRTRTLKQSASFFTKVMTDWKVPYLKFEESTCLKEAFPDKVASGSFSTSLCAFIALVVVIFMFI